MNSDTLTITKTGTGLLRGTGLAAGANGTYTLTGTAAAITTNLDALVFTPVDGVSNTSVTTSFTLQDADATAGTSSATSPAVTVKDSDPAGTPTAAAQTDAIAFNTATAVTLSGTDPDSPALSLTYAIATGPAHGTLSGTGANQTYTPVTGYQGTDSFTFTDSNGTNTSAAATVSLNVAAGKPTAAAQSDAVAFNTAKAITLSGSDPDSPALSLTYAIASGPAHGTLSGTGANQTYTPATGYQGADSFTFTDSNGTKSSAAATVSLTVAAGRPTAASQNDTGAFNTATAVTLSGTDPDSPALPLTYAIGSGPAHGTLSGTGPNQTYTPTAGYQGADSFTFTDSNGSNSSAAATVSLTVAAGTPTAAAQSDAVAFNTAKAISLTGSDPDSPALSLTYAIASGPAHGTLSGTGANQTYTPNAGYQGADSFTFTDTNGTNISSAATVSLTVAAGTPTAAAQNDTVAFNTATAITLTGSDPDSPALSLTYAIASGPVHGTLSGTGPNQTYTPTAGYQGADSFTFIDGNGTNSSAPATVSLTVSPPPLIITAPAAGSTVTIIDPTITGTTSAANAGSTITLTSGQSVLGSTTVASDGSWSDLVTLPTDGSYTIVATDTANGVNQGSASDTFTLNSTSNQSLFGAITHDVTSPGGNIYALYETILGRAPDAIGLENWVTAQGNGTPLSTIVQGFLSSGEYAADYGSSTQSNDAFINQLYQDGLHRQADAGGLKTWENALATGTSRAQVAIDIATSQESQQDLASTFQTGVFVPDATDSAVARLYYGVLGRAPDAAGLQTFETAVHSGLSLTQAAQSFLGSSEYQGTAVGQSNLNYIQGLYQTALGRTGEPGAVQNYETALDTGTATRATVANAFLGSSEFQKDEAGQTNSSYVNAVYQAALGRQADPNGLQTWDALLAGGTSRVTVAQDIVGSAEFASSVTNPAQATFINALYEGALGRPSDAGGLQANETAIAGGASLASIVLGVTQSAEAVGHLASAVETGFHIA